MKSHFHVFFFLAVVLSACGGNRATHPLAQNRPTPQPRPVAQDQKVFDGDWLSECVALDGGQFKQVYTILASGWFYRATSIHSKEDCSEDSMIETKLKTRMGDFTITGDAEIISGAKKIDFEEKDGEIVLNTYDIALLHEEILKFGDTTSGRQGLSDANRPNELNHSMFYRRLQAD